MDSRTMHTLNAFTIPDSGLGTGKPPANVAELVSWEQRQSSEGTAVIVGPLRYVKRLKEHTCTCHQSMIVGRNWLPVQCSDSF